MKIFEQTETTAAESKPLPNLLLCIALDAIGMMSFTIPFIGEFSDVIWAPLSGMIYYRMFGGTMGKLGGIFSFLEEALPFTDFIPTFTLGWFMRYRGLNKPPAPATPSKTIVINAR